MCIRDSIKAVSSTGAVELHYNGGVKFATTTDGVKITGGLQDKDGELGTSGQVLTSTGTQLNWVPASTVGGSVNTTYTLPDTGTDGTNFSNARGSATITLTGSDSTTDAVVITAGTNVKITNTGSGGFTINAQDTNDNTQLSTEEVQDIVGAMFSSNTETRISATYQDDDGTIDLVVDDMTADTQLTTEEVQDIVGAMVSSNTETRIAVTYNDTSGKLNFVVDDMTSDNNTTYAISAVDGDATDEEKIRLTGSNPSSTDDIVLEAGTGLSIARSGDKITLTNTVVNSDTQLSTEQVQDIVGAMVSSNTETRIGVTYDDTSGKLNFVVDDQSSDNNTTYGISAVDGDNSDEEKIRLTGNDSSTDDVVLEAGTGLSIARSGDKITLTNTDTGSGSSTTINNNADDRVITGGSGSNLNAEANLTFASNGILTVKGQAIIDEVNINDNIVQSNPSNTDLVLRATGTGVVKVDDVLKLDSTQVTDNNDGTYSLGGAHIQIGTNATNCLQIGHSDNGLSFISEIGPSDFSLITNGTNLYIQKDATAGYAEDMIHCIANGAVKLFYDGGTTPKVETTSAGAKVNGNLEVTGTVTGTIASSFPSGTTMIFYQASAPTGWTKSTTHNNKGLRVVSGNGGGSGGSQNWTSVFSNTKTTENHTLTTAQIPAHFHYVFRSGNHGQNRTGSNLSANNYPGSGSGASNLYEGYNISRSNSAPDVGRSQEIGSSTGHSHEIDLGLAYVDVIIASKD